jgi:hypothetical protein
MFYSNVPIIALWWITVISSRESNSKRESTVGAIDAVVGEMVVVALPVADVVGGGGGVYP